MPLSERACKYFFQHRGIHPPRILIIARRVIAIDQAAAIEQIVHRTMGETAFRQFFATGLHHGLMRHLPQGDDRGQTGQCIQRAAQIGSASAQFVWRWLVFGRQAFDRIEDHDPIQGSPIILEAAIKIVGRFRRMISDKPGRGERCKQQIARRITGKGPARAVGAMLAGRQADNGQPG